MIEFHELAKGIWVYAASESRRVSGVVLGPKGALLIDPGDAPVDVRATTRFLEEQGLEAVPVLFTTLSHSSLLTPHSWPGAHRIGAGEPHNSLSLADLVPGWEVVQLGPGSERLGAYNPKLKVLFCGDILPEASAGIPDLSSDSQDYLAALDRVQEMAVKLAIPARGAPATGKREVTARIESDRSYILSLYRHATTTQAANIPLERALIVAAEIYETFPFLHQHLGNLKSVWGEIEQELRG